MSIHSTAIIGKDFQIGSNVQIGPYCVIEDNVIIGNDNILKSHVFIGENTIIGNNNKFFQFCAIGDAPQDKKFNNEKTYLIIGDNNAFREYVNISRGTSSDNAKTIIGNKCLIMSSVHIAHDCILGDNIIISTNSALAGHVEIHDNVIIGGMSGVHQFCSIGSYSMIGGMLPIRKNILPYTTFDDRKNHLRLNLIGLRRLMFTKEQIKDIQEAIKIISTKNSQFDQKIKLLNHDISEHKLILDFIQSSNQKHGFYGIEYDN